jgi:hypothetical protein
MFITRMEHDILTVHHNSYLLELNHKYEKQWSICGVMFLEMSQSDVDKITNILF